MDLQLINKLSHDQLLKCFCENEPPKILVIAKEFIRAVDSIIKHSELKEHGLSRIIVMADSIAKTPEDVNNEWIYIVRPEAEFIKTICAHINADIKNGVLPRLPYKIVFAPRRLYICDLIFEQEGLYEHVVLSELENDFILVENDVLSMELPRFLPHYFINGDQSWLLPISKALNNIQEWFGRIPNVHLHGNCAKAVFGLAERLRNINNANTMPSFGDYKANYSIGHLVMVDRNIDFVTPFCSQLTYEGFIDELFVIDAGSFDLPDPNNPSKPKRIRFLDQDRVFNLIRSIHISEVHNHIKGLIGEIKMIQEKRDALTNVTDWKYFVKEDLKNFTAYKAQVTQHLDLSKLMIDQKLHPEIQAYLEVEHTILRGKEYQKSFEYIEELINRKFKMNEVLRLMVLLSRTNDGLSSSDYNQLCNQFLHNYGFDKLFLLQRLQKAGFFESSDLATSPLVPNDSKSNLLKTELSQKLVKNFANKLKYSTNYSNIVKKLDILPGDLSKREARSDMSYAYNSLYRPIMCKYISQILFPENGNRNLTSEFAKLFPGDYEFINRASSSMARRHGTSELGDDPDKTVLIVFLGGCTYTELSILKQLASQKGHKFIFATTSFINANSIFNLLAN